MTHMTTRRRTAELVPPSNAKFLHARLPDSRLDVLETGHFACEDGADEYLQLTRSWIESHRAARSKA
jgi:pimeloyl-ACP methyl ester carboxylesterase